MSKGLEALNSLFDTMPFAFLESNTMKELKIIEKELKALEIIKEKRVNIKPLKRCINLGDSYLAYNKMIEQECWDYYDRQLTKEEYDLLKEVLNA